MPGARKWRERCRLRAMGLERCNRERERESREGTKGFKGGGGEWCSVQKWRRGRCALCSEQGMGQRGKVQGKEGGSERGQNGGRVCVRSGRSDGDKARISLWLNLFDSSGLTYHIMYLT